MSRKPLIVVGGGGHGRVIIDLLRSSNSHWLAAVADDKAERAEIRDGVYYGPPGMLRDLLADASYAQVMIGIGDNRTRRVMADRLGLPAERYAVMVHPAAHVAADAVIGRGAVIMAGAVVGTGAVIGPHAIVNSGAVVEHDTVVGAFAHISPRAALAGSVHVMEGAHIGIGACVIPGLSIGRWSVLGAGAAAVRDVPDGVISAGVPARPMRKQPIPEPANNFPMINMH